MFPLKSFFLSYGLHCSFFAMLRGFLIICSCLAKPQKCLLVSLAVELCWFWLNTTRLFVNSGSCDQPKACPQGWSVSWMLLLFRAAGPAVQEIHLWCYPDDYALILLQSYISILGIAQRENLLHWLGLQFLSSERKPTNNNLRCGYLFRLCSCSQVSVFLVRSHPSPGPRCGSRMLPPALGGSFKGPQQKGWLSLL